MERGRKSEKDIEKENVRERPTGREVSKANNLALPRRPILPRGEK